MLHEPFIRQPAIYLSIHPSIRPSVHPIGRSIRMLRFGFILIFILVFLGGCIAAVFGLGLYLLFSMSASTSLRKALGRAPPPPQLHSGTSLFRCLCMRKDDLIIFSCYQQCSCSFKFECFAILLQMLLCSLLSVCSFAFSCFVFAPNYVPFKFVHFFLFTHLKPFFLFNNKFFHHTDNNYTSTQHFDLVPPFCGVDRNKSLSVSVSVSISITISEILNLHQNLHLQLMLMRWPQLLVILVKWTLHLVLVVNDCIHYILTYINIIHPPNNKLQSIPLQLNIIIYIELCCINNTIKTNIIFFSYCWFSITLRTLYQKL